MQVSRLFTKTKKQAPKDELTKNAQLLVQAGFVNKLMAGVYSFLPLGLKTLRRIEEIIRVEMNSIGGQEVLLPALQPAENWQRTGGWESIEVLFKIKSRTKKDYALGQSHEEVITPLIKEYVSSYKELPLFIYQIQDKYRDELRAKSGILRGREFGMKDMYSFHLDQQDFLHFYEIIKQSYLKIFKICGLTAKVTEASGGAFSKKISYEFMVLTDAGEDEILYCAQCDYCVNLTLAKEKGVEKGAPCPKCESPLALAKASEVGNVFDLGQKYTKAFDFQLMDDQGNQIYPIMGCYGIGTTRLMGVIVEAHHDSKGIVWPRSVAPYQVHLININSSDQALAKEIYGKLRQEKISVLWDDREVSAGVKFADADLIGIPVRLVISQKTGAKIEWKERTSQETQLLQLKEVITRLKV